jgi:Flp pilus assembly protein CpaB
MVSKPTAVTATALVASSALVALLCALHLAHKPALSATEALELVQRADVLAAGRDFHAAAALYEEALQHRSLPHREVANYNLAIALRDGGSSIAQTRGVPIVCSSKSPR